MSRQGVPTALLACRSVHAHPGGDTGPADVERAGRLMAYFIAGLDDAVLDSFRPALPRENDGHRFLKTLSEACGVSGNEGEVRSSLAPYAACR